MLVIWKVQFEDVVSIEHVSFLCLTIKHGTLKLEYGQAGWQYCTINPEGI